ncbi:MAG TPA: hypothetical protein VER33_25335 [Polyangiaceae bacterium]|nr:hypothetical protein [Polyangiaceae bacterium]
MRTVVSQMAPANNSPQTSNGARMVYPPVTGATTFDPGTTPFGVWASTTSGNDALHGTLNFSEDSLNTPANTHRVKVFTLKAASGPVANSYLPGFEEATNGDYQDYVFLLTNVRPAP